VLQIYLHTKLLIFLQIIPQAIAFCITVFGGFGVVGQILVEITRPGATKQQVIVATKKAHIHDFIKSLPNGYTNTLVGNNGIKLSDGQRQRISIARALLKDAPILVLDEITSALDSENETLIQKSLVNVMRGKTSGFVA
jgi:ABC-type multidrug transport system fused ATPase/permease subunit